MAINLDAVRQKLQAIQDSQTRKGSSKPIVTGKQIGRAHV